MRAHREMTHQPHPVCPCPVCFSVEGDAPGGEVGASVDPSGGYGCVPVSHGAGLGPQHLDSQLYGHIFLPGHQRPRRPKLQHSQSILRKQAEEEAIKRSRSLSESYELSSDLQDKQVTPRMLLLLVGFLSNCCETLRERLSGAHVDLKSLFRVTD